MSATLVGSAAPYHSGLVYKQPDGLCGAVEAGPNDSLECRTLDLKSRLYDWPHTLTIRRCKKQSDAGAIERDDEMGCSHRITSATHWADFCCRRRRSGLRGTVRKTLFGATYLDRPSYLCAELVVAGGTVGGIFDAHIHKGNSCYPRDLIFNDVYDLSPLYHEAQVWIPTAIEQREPAECRLGARFDACAIRSAVR